MYHFTDCSCTTCYELKKPKPSKPTQSYRCNTDIVMQTGTRIKAGVRFEIAENRSEVLGFYLRIPNGESYKVHLDWILSNGIVIA